MTNCILCKDVAGLYSFPPPDGAQQGPCMKGEITPCWSYLAKAPILNIIAVYHCKSQWIARCSWFWLLAFDYSDSGSVFLLCPILSGGSSAVPLGEARQEWGEKKGAEWSLSLRCYLISHANASVKLY